MIARIKIERPDDDIIIIPVSIPDLADVRAFAGNLHSQGTDWQGTAFGWQASYDATNLDTHERANFCIGESGVWFYSLMWENGDEADPVSFEDRSNWVS